ncbi:class I SAM-dependent methyltransferase, partial [Methylobacterium platani]
MVSSWREFWDRDTPIYVNARHKARHYAGLAGEIAALVPHPGAVVLDHGCGEASSADRVAEACGRLLLCDTSPRQRAALAARFAGHDGIAVLAPEEVAALPASSLDLVVANSLAQYLTSAELDACLRDWRRTLKPGGRLILADVIPPQLGAA